jgi:hypothetical protein
MDEQYDEVWREDEHDDRTSRQNALFSLWDIGSGEVSSGTEQTGQFGIALVPLRHLR